MWRDLAALYMAALERRAPSLAPLPLQYADYAVWQRRTLAAGTIEQQLAYWKRQLASAPRGLALPYSSERAAVRTFRAGVVDLELDAELSAGLRRIATRSGATVFMVVTATLRALLARYSGQDDLCIGTAASNRNRSELDDLIGFFVSTLVLRGGVNASDRFVDLLEREKQTALAAYANQDVPFDQVVTALGLDRSADKTPLLQVMCVDLGELAYETELLPGFVTDSFRFGAGGGLSTFELSVETSERAGIRSISIGYGADLFDHDTIADLARCWRTLLEAMVADPSRRIEDVPLLRPADHDRIVHEWNATSRDYSERLFVHRAIEAQVDRTPDAVAVWFEGAELTYRQLDERANRLAHVLRAAGARNETPVGVCMDRSLDMIVSLLAILKAGAPYMPIDPATPPTRIGTVIDDSGCALVVCHAAKRALFAQAGVTTIALDAERDAIDASSPQRPDVEVSGDSAAYLIFTSGSTGRPKGAVLTHRGFVNRLAWMQDAFALNEQDAILQKTAFTFDVSVWELFWALLHGARLVIARPDGHRDPRYLAELIRAQCVTTIHFVPSMLGAFIESVRGSPLPSLRRVICSGEALTTSLQRAFFEVCTAELHNLYGPTEATIDVSWWPCSAERPSAAVPIGAAGELFIGGVQLARGYSRRPDLTAMRFVADPFVPGERMYRTGDLARYRPDGAIEYLGRVDFQVKIRGFRIELEEIEAVLRDHPQVTEAVALARRYGDDVRLVAYIVPRAAAPTADELRKHAATRLPEYMVPSFVVTLEALPLTVSGKTDRKALPEPDWKAGAAAYVAPRNDSERKLAAIWSELLRVDQVGIHDNFFSLGGHSLLALRVIARISRDLGVDVTPRDVLERPTVAGLTERMDTRRAEKLAAGADPDEQVLAQQVATLSESEVAAHLAQLSDVQLDVQASSTDPRGALLERLIAQHRIDAQPNRPLARYRSARVPVTMTQQAVYDVYQRGNFPALAIQAAAFTLRGPLDVAAMQRAIAAVVARQAALRTTFTVDHGALVQTVQTSGPELAFVDLSHEPSAAREALARARFAAVSRPHDLTREVFRAELVRLSAEEHVLFLVPTHVTVDGFSWGIIEANLTTFYRAYAAASEPTLPPLELSYADFCFWQRTLEQRPVGVRQLAFWTSMLAGYEPLALAGDRGAPARHAVGNFAYDTYPAGMVPFALGGEAWSSIEQACARFGCSPYSVVATGFLLLLARWSGRNDVCTNSSSLSRSRPGATDVVGNFVTLYPLRVRFDEQSTLAEAVQGCHERVLGHREHAEVAPVSLATTFVEWQRYNLNYQLAPGDTKADADAPLLEPLDWGTHEPLTPHDLGLFVTQTASGLRGALVFNAQRFSDELTARAGERLAAILHAISTAPDSSVRELPSGLP
jgi:amino acid adenylation domain-containing protein